MLLTFNLIIVSGAAYGVSAFVKGQGVSVLKQLDIVTRLKDSVANGSINNRQGALFVLECLSDRLGLLFEPYIIQVVPVLLKSFSHSSDHVREAAQGTAKVRQLAKIFQRLLALLLT